MNRLSNEKGNMFLVSVLVILITSVVSALTLFYISEKLSFDKPANKVIDSLYEKDSKYELAKNLNLQYLDQLSYEDLEDIVWSGDDSSELSSVLKKRIYNNLYGNVDVEINALNDVYIKDLCFELVEEVDDEIRFIGFDCENESFDLNFELKISETVKGKKIFNDFEYIISNIYFEVSEDGSSVKLNLDDIDIKLMNLGV